MRVWQRLHSAYLIADQWLRVRADRCELPNGQQIEPYYVIEEKDWVQVFALDKDVRLLTVRQYRHGGGVVCTELPGGVVDNNEALLEAAQRELREETGYVAQRWRYVAGLHANPARQTNRVHVFVAQDLQHAGAQVLDATEEIEVGFHDIATVKGLIHSGEFSQSMHVASFYLCLEALAQLDQPTDARLKFD